MVKFVFLILGFFCIHLPTATSQNIKRISVWVNAFIPGTIPVIGKTDLTATLQNGEYKNKTYIEGPFSGTVSGLYLTDQRTFSSEVNASSRLHAMAEIDLEAQTVILKSGRCDPTHRINNSTDGELVCKEVAESNKIKVTNSRFQQRSDGTLDIKFKFIAAASNPCVPIIGGTSLVPDIDLAIDVSVIVNSCRETAIISAAGFIETFPAFELYLKASDKVIPVFQFLPEDGENPFDLYGPPLRNISPSEKPLPAIVSEPEKSGVWKSNDPGGRFILKIVGDIVEWTEKNPETGIVLTRTTMAMFKDGVYRIERINNDIEVLRMLGFANNIIPAITAAQPLPSYITFCIKEGKINAKWYGLSVTKKPNGEFDKLQQPGTKSPKEILFIKQ